MKATTSATINRIPSFIPHISFLDVRGDKWCFVATGDEAWDKLADLAISLNLDMVRVNSDFNRSKIEILVDDPSWCNHHWDYDLVSQYDGKKFVVKFIEDEGHLSDFSVPGHKWYSEERFEDEVLNDNNTKSIFFRPTKDGSISLWRYEHFQWFCEVLRINATISHLNEMMHNPKFCNSAKDIAELQLAIRTREGWLEDMDFDTVEVYKSLSTPFLGKVDKEWLSTQFIQYENDEDDIQ